MESRNCGTCVYFDKTPIKLECVENLNVVSIKNQCCQWYVKRCDVIEHTDTDFDKEKVIEELRQEAMHELGIPEEGFDLDEESILLITQFLFHRQKRGQRKVGLNDPN